MFPINVRVKAKEDINKNVDSRLQHWSPRMEALCEKQISVIQCVSEPKWFHGADHIWHVNWLDGVPEGLYKK